MGLRLISRARSRHLGVAAAIMSTALLAACGGSSPDISVTGAQVPVPPNPDVAAMYFVIDNDGGADVLTGVEADGTGVASMHRSFVNGDGSGGMEAVEEIEIGEKSSVEFRSGGYHVMIDDPGELVAGDTVTVTLSFQQSEPITVEADVVESLEEDPHGH
ncbi:MAG: copper chaperone PCu(A)C [Actinobacteria bacterium]|nr:copper chaperone PCu(A)C [Actinomycetota bacterium]